MIIFFCKSKETIRCKQSLKTSRLRKHICDTYFFFQIDLLTETRLNKIALQGFTLNGLPSFIRTFTLQTSEDGVNYETYQRNGRDVVRFYHTYWFFYLSGAKQVKKMILLFVWCQAKEKDSSSICLVPSKWRRWFFHLFSAKHVKNMIFLFVWCHASEEDVVDLVAPENQGIFGPRDKNYFKNGRTCFIIFFSDEKCDWWKAKIYPHCSNQNRKKLNNVSNALEG